MKFTSLVWAILGFGVMVSSAAVTLSNDIYRVELPEDGSLLVSVKGIAAQKFWPRFTVLSSGHNPQPEFRWGDWNDGKADPLYNVLSWASGSAGESRGVAVNRKKHVEDGFDPKSDQAAGKGRTQDLFAVATAVSVQADKAEVVKGRVQWHFPGHADFSLKATLELPAGGGEPLLTFEFVPEVAKWFSVGYTGAPEIDPAAMEGIWQPLIWQEKRFPQKSYLTESGRCTLPGTRSSSIICPSP